MRLSAGWLVLVVVVLVPARALPFGDDVTTSTECGSGTRATCCFTSGDLDTSGDNFYGPPGGWDWCRNDWINSMRGGFGVDADRWSGNGLNDPCNLTLPFGRFLTGVVALTETSPNKAWPNTSDRSGNILRWGAGFVWDTVDDIAAYCNSSANTTDVAVCSSCGNFLGLGDTEILLYVPVYFYSQLVEERASTLVHEARHWAGGPGHDSKGRDSSFGANGSWRWEVTWLSWYAAEATPAPKALRCDAQDKANGYLASSFATDPGIRINVIDCD
jgi:hypothetical protein